MFGQTLGKKVFVGLSGGVDSAVSAALLQKQGYDVIGVFIKIQIPGYPCPAAQDRRDAMRVAAHLKIPFIEIDLSKEYEKKVFDSSLKEFEAGRTPNPDAICNREIKFGVFYDFARSHGADFVATGHYAQTKDGKLYVSKDSQKDQSYFLWAIPEGHLKHVLFPVGDKTKPEVRKIAEKFSLPNATRPDSQGLCFLGDISITDMLKEELSPKAGDVLNEKGEVVGSHEGALLYTLGQRHGFIFHGEGAHTQPHFVVAKDIEKNTITVSPEQFPRDVKGVVLVLTDTNWIGSVEEGRVEARFRYRQKLIPAKLTIKGQEAQVTLQEPYYVPVGQSLVLYVGERCLGGGTIASATLE
jgi:tRNA-specific 2-thiouridylase